MDNNQDLRHFSTAQPRNARKADFLFPQRFPQHRGGTRGHRLRSFWVPGCRESRILANFTAK
jgi:hypothetical protein